MEISAMADRAKRFANSRLDRLAVRRLWPAAGMRQLIAELYLKGEGLEIGALNSPLDLPDTARARYVDRVSVSELREHYPGLDVIDIDIVDDGETLAKVAPGSQEFIIANHFLEHCQDPIRTLETLASRLKPGGVLYLAVPDADFTFDRRRPSTTFAHLVEDHDSGPERSREQHYREWVSLVEGSTDEGSDQRVRTLMDMHYSVHFHVWRMHGLLEFFARSIDDSGLQMSLELAMRHGIEVICVLRRSATP